MAWLDMTIASAFPLGGVNIKAGVAQRTSLRLRHHGIVRQSPTVILTVTWAFPILREYERGGKPSNFSLLVAQGMDMNGP